MTGLESCLGVAVWYVSTKPQLKKGNGMYQLLEKLRGFPYNLVALTLQRR